MTNANLIYTSNLGTIRVPKAQPGMIARVLAVDSRGKAVDKGEMFIDKVIFEVDHFNNGQFIYYSGPNRIQGIYINSTKHPPDFFPSIIPGQVFTLEAQLQHTVWQRLGALFYTAPKSEELQLRMLARSELVPNSLVYLTDSSSRRMYTATLDDLTNLAQPK